MFSAIQQVLKRSSRIIQSSRLQLNLQQQILLRGISSIPSHLRVGSHIDNLEDASIPFVLIETSFLSKCTDVPLYVSYS